MWRKGGDLWPGGRRGAGNWTRSRVESRRLLGQRRRNFAISSWPGRTYNASPFSHSPSRLVLERANTSSSARLITPCPASSSLAYILLALSLFISSLLVTVAVVHQLPPAHMSRYHSSLYPLSANPESSIHDAPRADLPRHDRDPSPSGSDSSSAFNNSPDNTNDDHPAPGTRSPSTSSITPRILTAHPPPDDPYHALTSQTLNADGTPKRPMNAFMIFARKRRPQISAANQMMRTGDVSKILSKEWNSMDMVFQHSRYLARMPMFTRSPFPLAV